MKSILFFLRNDQTYAIKNFYFGVNDINKLLSSLWIKRSLVLDVSIHLTVFNQSESIISESSTSDHEWITRDHAMTTWQVEIISKVQLNTFTSTGSSPPKLQKSTSGSRLTGPNPIHRTPSLSGPQRSGAPSWALRARPSSPASPYACPSPRPDSGQRGTSSIYCLSIGTDQYTCPCTGQFTCPNTGQFTCPNTGQYTCPYTDKYTCPYTDKYTCPCTGQYACPYTSQYTCLCTAWANLYSMWYLTYLNWNLLEIYLY